MGLKEDVQTDIQTIYSDSQVMNYLMKAFFYTMAGLILIFIGLAFYLKNALWAFPCIFYAMFMWNVRHSRSATLK